VSRIFVLFLLSTVSLVSTYGQDIHWSQFNDNPLFQNPASAGQFNGDQRFIANYRDQWRSVTVPFSSLSLSTDTRLEKIPGLGIGLLLFHDVAGDGQFRTIEIQGNVAYGLKLNQDSTHLLRFGVNVGMNHRQVNWDKFYFDNQYNGIVYDPSLPTNEIYQHDRKTNASVGGGMVYEWHKNERQYMRVGYGAYNLNRPNQGFYNQEIQRDIRHCAFVRGMYPLGFDWDILPAVQFSSQGPHRELIAGASMKYTLIKRAATYRALYAGLWYRNLDAACFSAGLDYQDLFVGLSYDINFSTLVPASRMRGGFEIALRYIIHHFKPAKVIHRVCPDFI
jgi:type IX secretion system PorP/SprF family membrane protein